MSMATTTVVLALGWFAIVNAAASLAAWVAVRGLIATRPGSSARCILFLRLFPGGASTVFAAGVFLPSHLVFEPRDADETLGLLWYSLAATGAIVLLRSAMRARRVWRANRQLHVARRPAPQLSAVSEVDFIAGVSLAGVIRPRVLIGRGVARELSSAELDVAIAHELAHRDAFDNLARWLILCAPDFVGQTVRIRQLETAWHEAAESLADSRAVAGDRTRALHLASALIKVARLTTLAPGHASMSAWSTLIDPPLLERRVRQLLCGPLPQTSPGPRRGVAFALALALGIIGAMPVTAGSLHWLTEELVRLLP
jgi:beta-lactamase regulating signal transducer with metallopeptidase domain